MQVGRNGGREEGEEVEKGGGRGGGGEMERGERDRTKKNTESNEKKMQRRKKNLLLPAVAITVLDYSGKIRRICTILKQLKDGPLAKSKWNRGFAAIVASLLLLCC